MAGDDTLVLEAFDNVLSKARFRVITASNTTEVVAKFIESRPDLVLFDCGATTNNEGSDLNAASEMLEINPACKIIMLNASGDTLVEAEKIGVELFLRKPVSRKDLLAAAFALSTIRPPLQLVSQ